MTGQGEQGERVRPKKSDEPLDIDQAVSRVLVDYQRVVEATRKSVELLNEVAALIEIINQGLPRGYMIKTYSESHTPYSMAPAGYEEDIPHQPLRGSTIYRPDENGVFRPDGEVATVGSREVFLGDIIMVTDENVVVIINTELGVGITASSEVTIANVDVESASSEPQRIMRQFANLMSMVDEVRGGESKRFDTSYL